MQFQVKWVADDLPLFERFCLMVGSVERNGSFSYPVLRFIYGRRHVLRTSLNSVVKFEELF